MNSEILGTILLSYPPLFCYW